MTADPRYDRAYFEDGVGSNYHGYADDPGWRPTAEVLLAAHVVQRDTLDSYRPSLLEVGAAKGWFLHAAHAAGFDAWGVDVSEYAVSHPAPAAAGRLLLGGVDQAPLDPFDVVCSWEVLEHIDEGEVLGVVRAMVERTRHGGLMVHRICLPGSDDHDVTHVTVMPREWWHDVFDVFDLARVPDVEEALNDAFAGRDWAGRFFAYTRP